MSERFFVPTPITGTTAQLVDTEAQHLAKVMRAQVGDELTLFDGSGAEFLAKIGEIRRGTIDLTIVERREVDREATRAVTLAVSLPKGDRQQWLVEKLTELGVRRLIPLQTKRSVAQPVASALARMERWVIEASKQCGRNRLLEIAPPQTWEECASATSNDVLRLFAHTNDANVARQLSQASTPIIIAVGPEGGWSDEEAALASEQGWQTISLGKSILRVETAAIAAAVLALG